MTRQVENCLHCRLKSEILCFLNTEQLEQVNENRYETKFTSGEIIFKQGMPISHVVFVRSGYAKLYIEGDNKEKVLLAVSPPGQYLTGPGLYFEKRYQYSAAAYSDLDACFIDVNLFYKYINENEEFRIAFLEEFCKRSAGTLRVLMNVSTKKMNGRLAQGLLYLSKIFSSNSFDCKLSRKELGELTNMAKESVSRVMKQFEDEHVIQCDNDTITLLDVEKLKRYSELG